MPDNYTNTVPQGTIGTGNAQVYGVNPLANQFANQLGNLRRKQELDAQKLAQSYKDNELAASGGYLWANDMIGVEKTHFDKGVALRQKNIDPSGSSQEAIEYRADRARVQSQQGYRKGIETQMTDALTKIRANPNKYTPESIQKLNDWTTKTKLSEAYARNELPPQLEERFDEDTLLKGIKGTSKKEDVTVNGLKTTTVGLDRDATKQSIKGAYLTSPQGRTEILKATGGVSPGEVELYSTNYADNVKKVMADIAGTPGERERLAAENILSDTPEMKEYVSDLAEQYGTVRRKYDNWINSRVDRVGGGIASSETDSYFIDPRINQEATLKLREEGLAIQRGNAARLANKDAGNKEAYEIVNNKVFTGDNVMVLNRNTGKTEKSKERLTTVTFDKFTSINPVSFGSAQIASAFNTGTGRNEHLDGSKSGEIVGVGWTTVTGDKKKLKAILINALGEEYAINLSDMPVKQRNQLSGAIQALGGAPQAPDKTFKRSDIPARIKGSGYTVKEYEDLLIKAGVKII